VPDTTPEPSFTTPESIIHALKRYRDVFDPKTGSLILIARDRFDPSRGPFRAGFIDRLEERQELRRRMTERIQPRERKLLYLWYVADLPVTRVARMLGISRMHCYRLRKDALSAMCDEEQAS
jgi:DNA-directed RNA polymerase specialized sigma24 family protein